MNSETKQKAVRLAPMLVLAGIIAFCMDKLVVAKSESVDYTLFWETGGAVEAGDYITFEFQHEYVKGGRPYTLTKRASCMPGQFLELRAHYHFCDGEKLGFIRERGDSGVPLSRFEWNGPVPEGHVFAFGDHEKSFDSRYWGFVPLSKTTKVVGIL